MRELESEYKAERGVGLTVGGTAFNRIPFRMSTSIGMFVGRMRVSVMDS